jgi:hypothetical protein
MFLHHVYFRERTLEVGRGVRARRAADRRVGQVHRRQSAFSASSMRLKALRRRPSGRRFRGASIGGGLAVAAVVGTRL